MCVHCVHVHSVLCVCTERLAEFSVSMHATCARALRTYSVSGCSLVCVFRLCVHVTVLEDDISSVPRSVQNIKQVLTCRLQF